MTQRAHLPREAGPALLLTGERRFGRYLVVLRGHELLITYTHYNLLIELLLAKRDPLGAGYAAAGAYPNVSRVAVCRLRHQIDAQLGQGTGMNLIDTGAGEEYRLNLRPEEVALDPGVGELVPLGVLTAAQLQELQMIARTLPQRWQPRDLQDTEVTLRRDTFRRAEAPRHARRLATAVG